MNNTKRTLSGLLALGCIISTVGCGGKTKDKTSEAPTADKVMEKAYQAVEMDCDVPFRYLDKMTPIGDTGKILVVGGTDTGMEMYITDYEFLEFDQIHVEDPQLGNTERSWNAVVTGDGGISALVTVTDYGDFELPDYDDPDFDYENFDYDAMEKAAQCSFYVYNYDSEGNLLETKDINGLEKFKEDDGNRLYLSNVMALGSDKLVAGISGMYGETYVVIGTDGTVIGKLDLDENTYLYSSGNDKDGNIVYNDYSSSGMELCTIDAETMSVSPDKVTLEDSTFNFNCIFAGNDQYKLFLSDTTALYGLKDDDTVEEIINWVDSDLNGDYINAILPLSDGDFIAFERDWSSDTKAFYRLTKRDVSDLQNVKVISLVVQYSDDQLISKVKEFNKSSEEYRIKVEDYSKYYSWDDESGKTTNTPEDQLKKDIGAGKTFDMIYMGSDSTIFNNLGGKGALVDLYTLMGADGTVKKEDLVEPALLSGENNGKLVCISPSFTVQTYACKTKFCSKENWTIDDMIETFHNAPEGMKLYKGMMGETTKMDVFGMFIYGNNDFIDFKKGVCSFDSPDFLKVLKFCDEFAGEDEQIDWSSMTQDDYQSFYEESELECRNDKALLDTIYFDDMRGYKRAKQGVFDDDITLVGNPSGDGTGAVLNTGSNFAIMSNSSVKEECWRFISSFFTEEYQNGNYIYNIPVLKTAFEKRLDDAMGKPYWIDPSTGKKTEYDDSYWIGDKEIKLDPLTKAERDFVEQYILSAKPSKFYYDTTIVDIIVEEVEAFFAGEKTAEQTADIIQNRVSILVSEQS